MISKLVFGDIKTLFIVVGILCAYYLSVYLYTGKPIVENIYPNQALPKYKKTSFNKSTTITGGHLGLPVQLPTLVYLWEYIRIYGATPGNDLVDEMIGYLFSIAKKSSKTRDQKLVVLSESIQKRLQKLQNTAHCNVGQMVVCAERSGVGFGSYIHSVAECLLAALATNRTAVFKEPESVYGLRDREEVFQPFSSCDYKTDSWRSDNIQNSPATLPKSYKTLMKELTINELAKIPEEILSDLLNSAMDPFAWWVGQIVRYCMRTKDSITETIQSYVETLPHLHIGVHIRRTDKITEEAYIPMTTYVQYINFISHMLGRSQSGVIFIYVMTDDYSVIDELQSFLPDAKVLFSEEAIRLASTQNRYTKASLLAFLMDLYAIVSSDFVVCSHISNVCRLAAELFNSFKPEAKSRLFSIQSDYHFMLGQNTYFEQVILEHKPRHGRELELRSGDMLQIKVGQRGKKMGDQKSGYCKGQKVPDGRTGMYPCFKATRIWETRKYNITVV